MALTAIAMQTGASLNGRALARNGAVTLDTSRINRTSGCGYGVASFVKPPTSNVLAASLGVPSELHGPFPWLLVIALGATAGATVLAVTGRRRRPTAITNK